MLDFKTENLINSSQIKRSLFTIKGNDIHKLKNYMPNLINYLQENSTNAKSKLKEEVNNRQRKLIFIHDSYTPYKSICYKFYIFNI